MIAACRPWLFAFPLAIAAFSTVAGEPPLVGSHWRAERIDGEPVLADATPTLAFVESDRVAGSGGCNRFFGGVTFSDGGRLKFGALASTKMACAPPVLDQEQRFLDALAASTHYRVDGALVLSGEDGVPRLVLAREP